jgi:hypothetical protein
LAAFLLGVWLGCSLLVIWFQFYNLRFDATVLNAPSDSAARVAKTLPEAELRLMLRYQASEENRHYAYLWEEVEIGLAVALGVCLFLGTEKRIFPLLVCAFMLAVVLFKHIGVTPQLAYLGRQADFPPGNNTAATLIRVYTWEQVYGWMEGAKLILGLVLASYLFSFRTRRSSSSRKQVHAVDHPDHRHINR